MKFLIFSYYNKLAHHGCSFDELAKTTIPTYKEYCEKHGYDFYCKTQNFTEGRTVGWSKFEIFLENMDKYDWMFYVECDSMLMNQTIRLVLSLITKILAFMTILCKRFKVFSRTIK